MLIDEQIILDTLTLVKYFLFLLKPINKFYNYIFLFFLFFLIEFNNFLFFVFISSGRKKGSSRAEKFVNYMAVIAAGYYVVIA